MAKTTRVLVVCAVVALVAAAVLPTLEARAPVPVIGENDVRRLIDDLGHKDEARRERAYEKLVDMGPKVVTHEKIITAIREGRNEEAMHRLLTAIQEKHGMPHMTANGLRFRPKMPTTWVLRNDVETTPVSMAVTVENVTAGKVTVNWSSVLHLRVQENGRLLDQTPVGRHYLFLEVPRTCIKPGGAIDIPFTDFGIKKDAPDGYTLSSAFAGGNRFAIRDLRSRRIFVFISNPTLCNPSRPGDLWQGHIDCPPVAVTIR